MDEAEAFIENFLQHAFYDKEARKRYNREYYLKTRKLKGKLNKTFNDKSDVKLRVSSTGRRYESGNVKRKFLPDGYHYKDRPDLEVSGRQQGRIQLQEQKIKRARIAAKKLSPEKRNAVEKKLDAVERKLNKFKKGAGKKAKQAELGYNRAVFKLLGSDYDDVVQLNKDLEKLNKNLNEQNNKYDKLIEKAKPNAATKIKKDLSADAKRIKARR